MSCQLYEVKALCSRVSLTLYFSPSLSLRAGYGRQFLSHTHKARGFSDVLRELGFVLEEYIQLPQRKEQGFNRPMFVFRKPVAEPSEGRGREREKEESREGVWLEADRLTQADDAAVPGNSGCSSSSSTDRGKSSLAERSSESFPDHVVGLGPEQASESWQQSLAENQQGRGDVSGGSGLALVGKQRAEETEAPAERQSRSGDDPSDVLPVTETIESSGATVSDGRECRAWRTRRRTWTTGYSVSSATRHHARTHKDCA